MSQYKETLADGTVRIVTYNPHHDGPVSERLTLTKRLKWLNRQQRRRPHDGSIKQRILDALNKISLLKRTEKLTPQKRSRHRHPKHGLRQQHRHRHRNDRFARTSKAKQPLDTAAVPQPKQRLVERLEPPPDNANPPPASECNPFAPLSLSTNNVPKSGHGLLHTF
jgi:hypothetical protein